jgi:hypothetical protein
MKNIETKEQELARVQSYFKRPLSASLREAGWSEQMLTSRISDYLREYHPTIPFQMDMSGEHLSKVAATRSAKNRAGLYKQPDLTVYVKKGKYGCLMLELKKLSAHPLKKDGTLKKNEHIELQARSIEWLRKYGMCSDFAVGYEDTIKKINDYLSTGEIEYLYKK